jgi:hypothetical protein
MMIRPMDQISLTDKELGEELTRLWKAENPNAPHNIAHFSHKDKSFKHVATVEQSEFHLMQVRVRSCGHRPRVAVGLGIQVGGWARCTLGWFRCPVGWPIVPAGVLVSRRSERSL